MTVDPRNADAVSDPSQDPAPPTPPDSPDGADSSAIATASPTPRRGGSGWFVILLVLLLGGGAFWLWRQLEHSEERVAQMAREAVDEVQARQQIAAQLESLRSAVKSIETRAADNAATNKILREELLGMGERASLLEDAVARLADNRLRGEVMLRLNEAEFLLLMGQERLRLFGDVAHAIDAYLLADAVLAGLDDPILVTTRQTLAQELLDLRSVQQDPRPALRARIDALATQLEALPVARGGEVALTASNDSRLMQLLGQLVTVRRVSDRDAVLGPVQRETTLAALRLQLELAQAALARPDPAAYAHALQRSADLASRLFDGDATAVRVWRDELDALDDTSLLPELPVLGATLQELRGLRATRSVGAIDRARATEADEPASASDAPAAEAAGDGGEPR
jgi:uroporphyrin-3 C-methyltransferase